MGVSFCIAVVWRSSPPRTDHARQDFQIKLIGQQQGNENLPGYGVYVGLF